MNIRKISIIFLIATLLIVTTGCVHSNENISDTDNDSEWHILSTDAERYRVVMCCIGENFYKSSSYSQELYSKLNSDEQVIVEELYEFYSKNKDLPNDFKQAFTDFCIGPEYENMIIEGESNEFYAALTNSFIISWKSDNTYYLSIKDESENTQKYYYDENGLVGEEHPYIISFDDSTYNVGKCTFNLNEIQIISSFFKVGSYINECRIFITVENNSNVDTIFSMKNEVGISGSYYQSDGDIRDMASNTVFTDNKAWGNGSNRDVYADMSNVHTIPASSSKDICVQLSYITLDKLEFADELLFDFYFMNENNSFTLSVNTSNK